MRIPLRLAVALWTLAAGALAASGCAAISGLDSLEVVDCVSGDCREAGADGSSVVDAADGGVSSSEGATSEDAPGDRSEDAPASFDAPPDVVIVEASADAPIDTGSDGPVPVDGGDSGSDAGHDSGTDSGFDSGIDSGVDSGADAGSDASTDAGAADAACPGTAGPIPVRVDGFCIDSTEVTVGQYDLFLAAADAGTVAAQPSYCSWNTSYDPSFHNGASDTPIDYVDWCDAYAFCRWAGKRLCGAVGGGSTPFASYASASSSQWFNACSADGTVVYPYGDTYGSTTCNGKDAHLSALTPVGSLAGCVGGYPGIYDMSGNVWEWEDSCSASTGATDPCRARGGGYGDTSANLECAADSTQFSMTRQTSSYSVGIRCCSP